MSARIAPEPIAPIVSVAAYRPLERVPAPVAPAGGVEGSGIQSPPNPYMEAAKVTAAVNTAVTGTAEQRPQAPDPSFIPPVEPVGSTYVRAVISGALSPRPTSAIELFTRVGTGWVPPESEFRLADKTI